MERDRAVKLNTTIELPLSPNGSQLITRIIFNLTEDDASLRMIDLNIQEQRYVVKQEIINHNNNRLT